MTAKLWLLISLTTTFLAKGGKYEFFTISNTSTTVVSIYTPAKMYVCIIDIKGKVRVHQKHQYRSAIAFLKWFFPYLDDVVIGVECVFLLVLGVRLVRRASNTLCPWSCIIHEGHPWRQKQKNDKIDSYKLASLLKGGNFPVAYPYPADWRATRDLLRRRMYLVRRCSELVAHIVKHQYPV